MRIKKIAFMLVAIVSAGAIIPMISYVTKKTKDVMFDINDDGIKANYFDNLLLFPELEENEIYKYIKIKDGVEIIDDDMIAKCISYISYHSNIPYGKVFIDINKISEQNVELHFMWEDEWKQKYNKNYSINISI